MVALTTKLPKNTYKDLLQVSNTNSGVDATLRNVSDGEGTASALSVSTTVVGVADGAVGAPGLEFTDDADNGLYRIGANNWGLAVAGALAVELDPIGAVQLPLQPAFLVRPATAQSDIATGGDVRVVWGTEIKDNNGDFASNTFTAPVAGLYLLTSHVALTAVDSAGGWYRHRLTTSNRNYDATYDADKEWAGDPTWANTDLCVVADMDAADTVTVDVQQNTGTQQTDITVDSFFSGCLLA